MKVKQKISELFDALYSENAALHREVARLKAENIELRAREFHRAGQVVGVSLETIEFSEVGE